MLTTDELRELWTTGTKSPSTDNVNLFDGTWSEVTLGMIHAGDVLHGAPLGKFEKAAGWIGLAIKDKEGLRVFRQTPIVDGVALENVPFGWHDKLPGTTIDHGDFWVAAGANGGVTLHAATDTVGTPYYTGQRMISKGALLGGEPRGLAASEIALAGYPAHIVQQFAGIKVPATLTLVHVGSTLPRMNWYFRNGFLVPGTGVRPEGTVVGAGFEPAFVAVGAAPAPGPAQPVQGKTEMAQEQSKGVQTSEVQASFMDLLKQQGSKLGSSALRATGEAASAELVSFSIEYARYKILEPMGLWTDWFNTPGGRTILEILMPTIISFAAAMAASRATPVPFAKEVAAGADLAVDKKINDMLYPLVGRMGDVFKAWATGDVSSLREEINRAKAGLGAGVDEEEVEYQPTGTHR